jgi:hypothetical protein
LTKRHWPWSFGGAASLAQNFEKASFLAFSRSFLSLRSGTLVTFAPLGYAEGIGTGQRDNNL